MKAQDVMSSQVVPVRPDMKAREIARLMRERQVDAVPVVEADGRLVGMIGRQDLLGRADPWPLALLSEDESEAAAILDKLSRLRQEERSAADIMAPSADTVRAEADLAEIAGVLEESGLEQVPVVGDGRALGIVSRGDLLRAFAAHRPARQETAEPGLLERVFINLDQHFQRQERPEKQPAREPEQEREAAEPASAEGFQKLVQAFKHQIGARREERQAEAAEQREEKSAALAERKMSDEEWQGRLRLARDAAEHGQTEFLLLRFPNQLCSDGGRAVNAPEPSWPETLRGEAADVYRRYEAELKPQGFELTARVVDYTDGMPGDIGLFLSWGEKTE